MFATRESLFEPLVEPLGPSRDLLAIHQASPLAFPFLLESVDGGSDLARFDILFHYSGESRVLHGTTYSFLSDLDEWVRDLAVPAPAHTSLPFRGGWFLYLGYELAASIEPHITLPSDSSGFPTALAARCPAALIRDRKLDLCYAVCESGCENLLPLLRDAWLRPGKVSESVRAHSLCEEHPEIFLTAVARAHEYILAGDVFQVNLSREWQVKTDSDAAAVYGALRRHNPAPFAGLANWQGMSVISSSPERLAEVRGDWVATRPIAGTRPRSTVPENDQLLRQELISHPKERAEHIMLIDLERNDVGRVCVNGSVDVTELMVLESYRHVHHIVSNVRGRLRPDATPGDVIRAVFPGGTITGCPKVRCMELIAELESQARGCYTGSMGYLNRDGDMDLNILIRTIFFREGECSLRAGAGIVADSVGERELEETRSKAKGMLTALGIKFANDWSKAR